MRPVRLLRLKANQRYKVRILSEVTGRIGGEMTVYTPAGSRFVPSFVSQEESKERFTWKGFLCVLYLVPEECLWRHAVLEVTEHLELAMRGDVRRGQTWLLSRGPDRSKGKRQHPAPVCGVLQATEPAEHWPQPFEMRDVIAGVYGCRKGEVLELATFCPLPDKLFISDIQAGETPKQTVADVAENNRLLREMAREAAEKCRMPR